MAYTMVYRGVKGSPLTNTEVDTNFQNLDTFKAPLDAPQFTTSAQVTGQLTAISASGALIASNGGGTGQTSIQLKRTGAAVDQKMYEINSDSSGAFVIRSVNDAYSSNAAIITAQRGTTYTMATLTLMSSGGRVLVGSGTDDGVNALQVTGNIETDSKVVLSGSASGLEIGAVASANSPYVDFHSSGNNIDYDARIYASGGSTTVGAGTLSYNANSHYWNTPTGTVMYFTSAGRLLIGTQTDDGVSGVQVANGNILASSGIFTSGRYGSPGALRVRSAGGTSASPTATGLGVTTGLTVFTGYDGTNFQDGAQIAAIAEAAYTSTSIPTRLVFMTAASGTTTMSEGMRLTSANRLLVNQTADNLTHTLQVTNGIISTSSGSVGGLVATGAASSNSGLYLINTTASTGRSFSVLSGTAGNLSINDETAGTVSRIVLVGGANRILLGGATDDAATTVQIGGTLKTSAAATIGGNFTTTGGSTTLGSGQTGTIGLELGSATTTGSFVDFHSSGNNLDYDTRLIATGGTTTVGQGTLSFYGTTFGFNCTTVSLTSQVTTTYSGLLVFKAGSYAPFMRANSATTTLEWVNSANTAVNMTLYDSGQLSLRAGLTCTSINASSGIIVTNGSCQLQGFGGATNSGVLYFGTSGNRYLYYNASSDTYTMPNARVDFTNGANQISLTFPGKAQWFPCVDGAGAFTVYNAGGTGVYISNGATAWTANSDERLKNIREDITGAVEKVEAIRTVKFTWKSEDDYNEAYGLEDDSKRVVGVIAQDVLEVLPEAVTTETLSGYLGVQYTDLVPLALAAIKELSARVKELEAKLAEKE